MTLYVQRSDGGYSTHEGMSQATVTSLLTALAITGTFISKATYDANCPKR